MPLLSLAIEEHRACAGYARHFDAVGSTDPRLRSPTVAPQSWPLVWCFLFWGFSLKSCTSCSAPGHAGTLGAVIGMSHFRPRTDPCISADSLDSLKSIGLSGTGLSMVSVCACVWFLAVRCVRFDMRKSAMLFCSPGLRTPLCRAYTVQCKDLPLSLFQLQCRRCPVASFSLPGRTTSEC